MTEQKTTIIAGVKCSAKRIMRARVATSQIGDYISEINGHSIYWRPHTSFSILGFLLPEGSRPVCELKNADLIEVDFGARTVLLEI